jgi:hypothetical protein
LPRFHRQASEKAGLARDGFRATRVVVTDVVDVPTDGVEIEGTAEIAIDRR